MEQVIFISKVENLKYFKPYFTRLYFGNEFCEQLMPSVTQLEHVLNFVSGNNLDFTLVTPYITDNGLKRLDSLLHLIAQKRPDSEVVFNDYGVLRVLRSRYNELEPVMGRLLNRMKRGPRLMMVIDKLPKTTVEYFQHSNLPVIALTGFLNANGVRRVELDNILQEFSFSLDCYSVSLYLPYAYVTTSRLCLVNSCDIPEKEEIVGIFPCKQECQKYTFYLRNEIMPVLLIRKGNSIFFENRLLPDGIEEKGINRIVNEPEIPM
jgi:hypothetical protein